MTPHLYSEEQLVEQPAVELFSALGWQTASALEETFGASGTLGRETSAEVVLTKRLRSALQHLNHDAGPDSITLAVDALTRDRSSMSLVAANREIFGLLKDRMEVSVPDRERGGQRIERLRGIDWNDPVQNDCLLGS